MLNILRSIPWAFRITLHTAPIPFLETVQRANPGASEQHLRDQLARVLFRRESVHQHIGELSGGERFRAALATVLLTDPVPQILCWMSPRIPRYFVGGLAGAGARRLYRRADHR